jgi:hypothetical protein
VRVAEVAAWLDVDREVDRVKAARVVEPRGEARRVLEELFEEVGAQ